MTQFKHKKLTALICAYLSTLGLSGQAQADMIDLGMGRAYAISADGSVIGGSDSSSGAEQATIWVNGTAINLGAGNDSRALSVSADGTKVVGYTPNYIDSIGDDHAFLWTGSTITDLHSIVQTGGSISSSASAISSDGSTIVGYIQDFNNMSSAYALNISNNNTVTYLQGLTPNSYTEARGVSGDGSTIVGYSDFGGYDHATLWSISTPSAPVDLGVLSGGRYSSAFAISSNDIVVGYSDTGQLTQNGSNIEHATMWSNDTITDLGVLPSHTWSYAAAISANGSVIVGESWDESWNIGRAVKWSNGTITDLGTFVGGTWSVATGVSADGSVIVGYGDAAAGDRHAFVYRGSMVDVNNTYSALSSDMHRLSSILNLQNNLLNIGLNHDCTQFGANNLCVAVGGGYSNSNSPTASQTSANLRVAYQVAPNVRIGAFADQSISNSTPGGFDVKNNMPLIGAFAAWSQNNNGVGAEVKASVAYNRRDVDITRSVLDNTEAGSGNSKLTTKGAQIEGAYGVQLSDRWLAQPFLGLRVGNVKRAGYTETAGASFPIAYDDATQTYTTAYVGGRLAGKISEKATAHLAAGVEQDLRHHASNNSGVIDTMGAFNLSAPNILHTRAFVRGSVNYAVTPNSLVDVSLIANQDALNHATAFTGMASYSIGF